VEESNDEAQTVSTISPSPPILTPSGQRNYPDFSLTRLLDTVFEPTQGCRVCILIDLEDVGLAKDFGFLNAPGHEIQKNAYRHFYLGLRDGAMSRLGLSGGEMFAYRMTGGSNLDLDDDCWNMSGRRLESRP